MRGQQDGGGIMAVVEAVAGGNGQAGQARPGEQAERTQQQAPLEAAEARIARLEMEVAYLENHLAALRTVLQQKQILTYDEVLRVMYTLETKDAAPGARVVARAWVDPAFKERLLADPKAACAELGVDLSEYAWDLQVLENTATTHHVAVCTTCSCYPGPLVGGPPTWYKSWGYRGHVVDQPREVLRAFGVTLGDDVEVRVVDTDRTRRAFVLPRRPAGTEGLSEAELAALVTQESLFGAGEARSPHSE
jgi:nitrile hydratase